MEPLAVTLRADGLAQHVHKHITAVEVPATKSQPVSGLTGPQRVEKGNGAGLDSLHRDGPLRGCGLRVFGHRGHGLTSDPHPGYAVRMAGSGRLELLICGPRAAHNHDKSLLLTADPADLTGWRDWREPSDEIVLVV